MMVVASCFHGTALLPVVLVHPQSEGRSHFGCPCRQIQVLVEPEGANFGAHTSLGGHQERTLNILINFLLFEHDCLGILPDLGKVMIHPNNL